MKRMNPIATILLALALISLAPRPAAADDLGSADDKVLTLGLKTGLYLPSLFNDLGPHANLAFEAGVLLPVLDRRLALVFEAAWTPPGVSGTQSDPRIGDDGGEWDFNTRSQQVHLSFGPLFRFLPPGETFVPYAGVLARMSLLRTNVRGSGGDEAFGQNTEESLQFGVVGMLGGELALGPGAALLEFTFGWSNMPHRITGDTSTAALGIVLGYRLML